MNPYKTLKPVEASVPAEMLESAAGWDSGDAQRELSFALSAASGNDSEELRWLIVCAARRLNDLS